MEMAFAVLLDMTFVFGVLLGALIGALAGVIAGASFCRREKTVEKIVNVEKTVMQKTEAMVYYVSDHGERLHWRKDCQGLNAARHVRELRGCRFCSPA